MTIIKEANEYEVYNKSYSSAIDEVLKFLKKKNFYPAKEEFSTEVTTGRGKPSVGKTTKHSLLLYKKDGTPANKSVNFQIYGMEKSYELNMYLSPTKKKDYRSDEEEILEDATSADVDSQPTRIRKQTQESSVSTDLQVDFEPRDYRSIIRSIREAIIAENDATNMYEKIADGVQSLSSENPTFLKIIETLQDIANEEKVHIGELHKVLSLLDGEEIEHYKDGAEEVGRN